MHLRRGKIPEGVHPEKLKNLAILLYSFAPFCKEKLTLKGYGIIVVVHSNLLKK